MKRIKRRRDEMPIASVRYLVNSNQDCPAPGYRVLANTLLSLLTVFFLVSCKAEVPSSVKKSRPPQKEKVVRVEEKVSSPVEAPVKIEKDVSERTIYDPGGKRDPFLPFIKKKVPVKEARPLTPLQRYSINQFKVVAIIWGIKNPRALVEDPEGKGHILKRGVLIGKRNGKVKKILKDKIIIEEEHTDSFGKVRKEEVILELPKVEELIF